MAASFTNNGSTATINFEFTAPTVGALALVEKIAEYHYNGEYAGEPIEYGDLTINQKLQVVHRVDRNLLVREADKIDWRNARKELEPNAGALGDS